MPIILTVKALKPHWINFGTGSVCCINIDKTLYQCNMPAERLIKTDKYYNI